MKTLICLTLFILVLASNMLLIAETSAATYVNGVIGSNTIWNKENTPYILTGNIFVNNNATLTIEPGVTVDLANYYIQINGTFNARGQSGNNIVFTSISSLGRVEFFKDSAPWNDQNASGCIIENCQFTRGVLIVNSSVRISSNTFNSTGLTVLGSSPIISNNNFYIQTSSITLNGGSPIVSYNAITGNRYSYLNGISVGSGATPVVSDNSISGCQTGIQSSGNATIQNNLIINNNQGISNYGQSSIIKNNVIAGNYYGITGYGVIETNTVANNSVGIRLSMGSLHENNIFNNYQNIVLYYPNSLDATNNWWGATDVAAINSTIIDSKTSSSGIGIVIFEPFLMQPNPLAPSLPNIALNPVLPITPPATPHPPTPTIVPTAEPTPMPSAAPTLTPSPTPTPRSTPVPTPKIVPGSPLVLGSENFGELLAQLDIMELAKLVVIALGIMWGIVILASVGRKYLPSSLRDALN